jgi:hypothetical protein
MLLQIEYVRCPIQIMARKSSINDYDRQTFDDVDDLYRDGSKSRTGGSI